MYAVFETGGKQYRVQSGDVIKIEKLPLDVTEEIAFDKVFLISSGAEVKVGSPTISGAKVVAQVIEQGKSRKILGMKYKSKKNYRRRYGHRQHYTQVKILEIVG